MHVTKTLFDIDADHMKLKPWNETCEKIDAPCAEIITN